MTKFYLIYDGAYHKTYENLEDAVKESAKYVEKLERYLKENNLVEDGYEPEEAYISEFEDMKPVRSYNLEGDLICDYSELNKKENEMWDRI